MKKSSTFAIGAAIVALPLLTLLYLFSLPAVYAIRLKLGDPQPFTGLAEFYYPVEQLALRCPAYAYYLQAEADFLGTNLYIAGAP